MTERENRNKVIEAILIANDIETVELEMYLDSIGIVCVTQSEYDKLHE